MCPAAAVLEELRRQPLVRALARASGDVPTHLVGGILRDRLLGLASRDVDAVVERDGRAIAERLAASLPARLVLIGEKKAFAAFRLVAAEAVIDLWDREGQPLERDLQRRDFTVNAFALDLTSGEVSDPCGGLADLRRRLLRAATPGSFQEDPLRVLRLARLAAQLPGFAADPPTLNLARAACPGLEFVARERIREELSLLLGSWSAHRGAPLLAGVGAYPGLWLRTPGRLLPPGRALAELRALPAARDRLAELAPGSEGRIEPLVAGHALLITNLPPGEAAAPSSLASLAGAGYLSRQFAGDVRRLLAWPRIPEGERSMRRLLHETGERLWPTAIAAAGARSGAEEGWADWEERALALARLARDRGAEIFDPPPLLTGHEVQELVGVPPGPELGRLLRRLREAQIEGRVGSRAEAEELVRAGGE